MSDDIICLGEPLVEFNEVEPGLWQEGFGGDVSTSLSPLAVRASRAPLPRGSATTDSVTR